MIRRVPAADLRAALLLLALVAHGIYALPLPRALTEKDLRKPSAQRDVEMWQDGLAAFGIAVERERLEQVALRGSQALGGLHKALKAPFRPAFDLVGANQSWALFASATTRPERLVVEIRRPGSTEWVPVLRRLDPCCTWSEDQLEYRRIRGVWDGQEDSMRPAYRGLTRWVARRAFEAFPDAERVRVRIEQGRSVYPWETPDPTLESRHDRIHRRSDLAPKDGSDGSSASRPAASPEVR